MHVSKSYFVGEEILHPHEIRDMPFSILQKYEVLRQRLKEIDEVKGRAWSAYEEFRKSWDKFFQSQNEGKPPGPYKPCPFLVSYALNEFRKEVDENSFPLERYQQSRKDIDDFIAQDRSGIFKFLHKNALENFDNAFNDIRRSIGLLEDFCDEVSRQIGVDESQLAKNTF